MTRSRMSARGRRSTRTTGCSLSACTRRSSGSSTTSTTSGARSRKCRSSTPSPSTTTTRSGRRSRTTTGRPSSSSTGRESFATSTSARAATSSRNASSSSCSGWTWISSPSSAAVSRLRDWDDLESPETYIGHARSERRTDAAPAELRHNQWALSGDWTVKGQGAVLNQAGGGIAYRFHARDLHLVLRPGETPVSFRVTLDGEAPGASHGDDVNEDGKGVVSEPRRYQLIRQPGRVEDRTFAITFLEPDIEASVFTFG